MTNWVLEINDKAIAVTSSDSTALVRAADNFVADFAGCNVEQLVSATWKYFDPSERFYNKYIVKNDNTVYDVVIRKIIRIVV